MELVDKYRETMLKLEVSVRNAKRVMDELANENQEDAKNYRRELKKKIKKMLANE